MFDKGNSNEIDIDYKCKVFDLMQNIIEYDKLNLNWLKVLLIIEFM